MRSVLIGNKRIIGKGRMICFIFKNSLIAWASYQRSEDETPYWRTLKANGELNPKYPGGVEAQRKMLEAEGHTIIQRGRKNIKYFVKDYEVVLFDLNAASELANVNI